MRISSLLTILLICGCGIKEETKEIWYCPSDFHQVATPVYVNIPAIKDLEIDAAFLFWAQYDYFFYRTTDPDTRYKILPLDKGYTAFYVGAMFNGVIYLRDDAGKDTLTHEIGHLLGIQGHIDRSILGCHVMNAVVGCYMDELTPEDWELLYAVKC